MAMRPDGVPRNVGLAIMLMGLIVAMWGQSVESDSFREAPRPFEGGPSHEDRARDRKHAHALKNAGVAFVLADPMFWLVSASWLKYRFKDKRASAPSGKQRD